MSALFVALGILVLALLALLLWFVPHLLQQQATRVSGETSQLREMLLDLLNEQEAVAVRQSQLSTSLSSLQIRLEALIDAGPGALHPGISAELVDARIGELQQQIGEWLDGRQRGDRAKTQQDNESWGYLMSLLAVIQERVGALSQDRATVTASARASVLLEDLEQEMNHLRTISEDISKLQSRLRRSLSDHENGVVGLRNHIPNNQIDTLRVG
jgi:chromosome segregation ATPase